MFVPWWQSVYWLINTHADDHAQAGMRNLEENCCWLGKISYGPKQVWLVTGKLNHKEAHTHHSSTWFRRRDGGGGAGPSGEKQAVEGVPPAKWRHVFGLVGCGGETGSRWRQVTQGPEFKSCYTVTVLFLRLVPDDHRHRPWVRLRLRISGEPGSTR